MVGPNTFLARNKLLGLIFFKRRKSVFVSKIKKVWKERTQRETQACSEELSGRPTKHRNKFMSTIMVSHRRMRMPIEFSQTFSLALHSTTEFFVFQQSFY